MLRRGLVFGLVATVVLAAVLSRGEPAGVAAAQASGDARLLAYEAVDGIHLIRADGHGDYLLKTSIPGDGNPRWSPDGRYLVVWRTDRQSDLFLLDVMHGRRQRLTNTPPNDEYPTWSADGNSIIFESDDSGGWRLYRLDLRSGRIARIYEDQWGISADVAADGSLTFTDPDLWRVFIGHPPAERTTKVPSRLDAYASAWFPDATRIAYTTTGDWPDESPRSEEIHAIMTDGTGDIRLTNNHVRDNDASVSPEADKIAFESGRFGWDEVMLMNPDGTHQKRLTYRTDGYACCASWQPRS